MLLRNPKFAEPPQLFLAAQQKNRENKKQSTNAQFIALVFFIPIFIHRK